MNSSEVEHKQSILFLRLGELFQVLKMMVGSNLKDSQLQQIVDKVRTEGAIDRAIELHLIRPSSTPIRMEMGKSVSMNSVR